MSNRHLVNLASERRSGPCAIYSPEMLRRSLLTH
jgi:hypothetical protein